MTAAMPFLREAGAGPAVLCLHSNASSSSQWRELMARLAPHFHVMATDGYGAGRGPAWPTDRRLGLRDEVALIEPVLALTPGPCTLVGHSYGGAVALVAALALPERVRALVLYEPTLFALVDAAQPPPNEADGIREAVTRSLAALQARDPAGAARHFIDYWIAPGAWDAMPAPRQDAIAASVGNVAGWSHALFSEPTPLHAFAALDIPVLYMVGTESPASAQAVARLLTRTLPRVTCVELEGMGHMAPLTHPEQVNELIFRFLERV